MRHLLTTSLLLLGLSSLNAATFLERFNSLEQDIQNVQDEVDALRKSSSERKSDSSSTKALEATIKTLQSGQKKLQTKVSGLKSQPQSSSKVPQEALSNEDVNALKKAIQQLKKEQKRLKSKVKSLKKRPVASAGSESSGGIDDDEMDEIQEQFDEISKSLSTIRKFTNGNHIKWTVDFRTSLDSLNYEMANGDKHGNDGILSNRLWLNMKYKATEKISFTGQLAYNKAFGARSGNTGNFSSYDQFDWVTNETANDDTVRLRKAYFFYANDTFGGLKMPWTFSIGRRPSVNGHLSNFREDDEPSSPSAHSINVEFDGFSSKFDLSGYTGISGQYIKFCVGRGLTNAAGKFSTTPYATNSASTRDIDLFGAIVSLYNNGQYSLSTQTYIAKNLIDINGSSQATDNVFEAVGDLESFSANFVAEGLGTEGESFLWSNWLGKFMDETTFFASYATSLSRPQGTSSMFGSTADKVGKSYWAGLQMPTLSEKGRWGLEFNYGDKYWRAITYAEDTLVGSKIAARGKAYEWYWTEPFANDVMSWQIRYTYIDYKYSGSNGFFGGNAFGTVGTGTPFTMAEAIGGGAGSLVVDKTSDLRLYLRYRY